jgi:hypothetical protein
MTEQERIDAAYFMVEAAADVMGSTRKVTYWSMADRFKDDTYTTSDLDTYLFLLEIKGDHMPSPSVEPSLQPEPSEFQSDGDELRRYRLSQINANLTIETPARVSSKLHDLNYNLTLDKVPALPRGEQSIRRDPNDPARGFDFYKCQEQARAKHAQHVNVSATKSGS